MTPRDLLTAVTHGRRPTGALEKRIGRPVVPLAPGSATVTGPVQVPLGPLAARPVGVSRTDALQMLAEAVAGLPVDSGDRTLLARAAAYWDPADVVILASLLTRAKGAEAPVTRWSVTCYRCMRGPMGGPMSQGRAEHLARHHDIVAHDGAWCAEAVPVDPTGCPIDSPVMAGGEW